MLILIGPSASGKTEAVKILIRKYNMKKLVTYTSRKPRIHEIDGVDYHFLTKEDFEKRITEGFFIEHVEYNGNYYGTSYQDLSSDKVVILEPQGVLTYLEKARDIVKVCYLRTPVAARYDRMLFRGDNMDAIKQRIASDDTIFNEEIEQYADWIIDSINISLDDMTEKIYRLYEPYR
jgi:guanylate kinase